MGARGGCSIGVYGLHWRSLWAAWPHWLSFAFCFSSPVLHCSHVYSFTYHENETINSWYITGMPAPQHNNLISQSWSHFKSAGTLLVPCHFLFISVAPKHELRNTKHAEYFDKLKYISFISTNGVKWWNQPDSSIPVTPLHRSPFQCVNPTHPPSTQRINYAEMNLTHKFLLWPSLHIWERQAALKCDSWPNLCTALGWPLAGGRGTWLGGTRSEMWRSCRRRHIEVCGELHCIPCCTPYPGPPSGTA